MKAASLNDRGHNALVELAGRVEGLEEAIREVALAAEFVDGPLNGVLEVEPL